MLHISQGKHFTGQGRKIRPNNQPAYGRHPRKYYWGISSSVTPSTFPQQRDGSLIWIPLPALWNAAAYSSGVRNSDQELCGSVSSVRDNKN